MPSNVIECPVVLCPVEPCPCPVTNGDWGFKSMILPRQFLKPGSLIPSPGGTYFLEVQSYPFSQLFLDFKGKFCKGRWVDAIAHEDPEWSDLLQSFFGVYKSHAIVMFPDKQRMFYQCLFLLLFDLMPLSISLGVTGLMLPHKDNNAWEQAKNNQWKHREYPASYRVQTLWVENGELKRDRPHIRTPRWLRKRWTFKQCVQVFVLRFLSIFVKKA